MVATIYPERIQKYKAELKGLGSQRSRIAWGRLACIVLALGLFIWQWPVFEMGPSLIIVVSFAFFLRLVAMAVNISDKIKHAEQLLALNEEELLITKGTVHHRFDGLEFAPALHPFAYDLDLFGRASLYQYSNRTESYPGKRTWAQWLLVSATNEEIRGRQEAAKELTPQIEWRQELQAVGREVPLSQQAETHLLDAQSFSVSFFSKQVWKIVRWIGPLCSVMLFLAYLIGWMPQSAFNLYLIVFFLITGYLSKKATPAYNQLGKLSAEIKTFSRSLSCIEKMPVHESAWLKSRYQRLHNKEGLFASDLVLQLNGILKRMDYRLNPVVFIPLNILFFWDLQQMIGLHQWQKKHSHEIMDWLQVLGEMETISSVATLSYNQPDWVFPDFREEHGCFDTKALGHPLIDREKRVVSDFSTQGAPMVNIITGSNMAGKSTFLRSVGLAMVMGQAGAPVCARQAIFSNMQVMSSMRIADNLEESTSTFYAELKNLKRMIEAVNAGERVFLLMDEILRGTNSLDRQKGSKALIQQLIRKQAVGLIATHDLELAEMEKKHAEAIRNYHFDVQVSGEELYFDYALKTGVCKSMNASILMKKIGIEMNG